MATSIEQDSARAWLTLAVLCIGMCINYGTHTTGSVLYTHLLDVFGESRSYTSLPIAVSFGIVQFCGIVASVSVNRFGCRRTLIGCAILTSAGLCVCFMAKTIAFLIPFYGVLAGLGQALGTIAFLVSVGQRFKRYRSFAYSIASTSLALGLFIMPLLFNVLAHAYTWRGALLLLGGINLNILPIACFTEDQSPEVLEETDEQLKKTEGVQNSINIDNDSICSKGRGVKGSQSLIKRILKKEGHGASDLDLTQSQLTFFGSTQIYSKSSVANTKEESNSYFYWDIFKMPSFIVLLMISAFRATGKTVILAHVAAIGITRGLSIWESSFTLTIIAAVQLITRPIAGLIASKFSSSSLLIWSVGIVTTGVVVILGTIIPSSKDWFFMFLAIFGISDGWFDALWGSNIQLVVGDDRLSSALGMMAFFYGIGATAGPPLAGLLYDKTGSYTSSLLMSGAGYFIAAVLCFTLTITRLYQRRRTKSRDKNAIHNDIVSAKDGPQNTTETIVPPKAASEQEF